MKQLPSCDDYITSIETPQLIKAEELRDGCIVMKEGKPLRYAGGFCIVFPYQLQNRKKVAVRCWIANVPDAETRCNQISIQLRNSKLPYFVGFQFIPYGIATSLGIFPIIIMDWVEAQPLKEYISQNLRDRKCLIDLAEHFLKMTKDMHTFGFSHGDLQHGNIMVSPVGQLYMIDYDSMFVPGLEDVRDEIKGLAGYQHPGRYKQEFLSSKSDYFSELIIYTSVLALAKYPILWEELDIENTETLVFSQEDIDNPERSSIFKRLEHDSSLASCIEAIKNALRENDIEKLLPLEEAIVPASVSAIECVQKKWKSRLIQENEQNKIDILELKSKWMQSPRVIPVDISTIITKWK